MAFVLTTNRTVKWPVTVKVPRDGGSTADQKFTAVFEILDKDQIDGLCPEKIDEALLARAFVGWDGIKDEAGNAVEFSEDTKAAVIKIPFVCLALLQAYGEAANGRRAKN